MINLIICEHCKKPFGTSRKGARFCSISCSSKENKNRYQHVYIKNGRFCKPTLDDIKRYMEKSNGC